MDIHIYPDDQMRQELVDFYNWKPDAVALRDVGFWFTKTNQFSGTFQTNTGTGWV